MPFGALGFYARSGSIRAWLVAVVFGTRMMWVRNVMDSSDRFPSIVRQIPFANPVPFQFITFAHTTKLTPLSIAIAFAVQNRDAFNLLFHILQTQK
jgi:hypothetical protein